MRIWINNTTTIPIIVVGGGVECKMMMSSSSIIPIAPKITRLRLNMNPVNPKLPRWAHDGKCSWYRVQAVRGATKCHDGIAFSPCSGLPSILGRGRLHRPLFALCYVVGIQDSLQSTVVYAALVGEFFGGWVLVSWYRYGIKSTHMLHVKPTAVLGPIVFGILAPLVSFSSIFCSSDGRYCPSLAVRWHLWVRQFFDVLG